MSREAKQKKRARQRERFFQTRKHSGYTPASRVNTTEPSVVLLNYNVSYDPIEDGNEANRYFAHHVDEDTREALRDAIDAHPRKAIKQIELLLQKYPDTPILYNWLAAANGNAGNLTRMREIVRLNYQANPTYLFARMNYADMCLNRDDFDEFEKVMDGKFEVSMMYPHRRLFHYTEVLCVSKVVFNYFVKLGKHDVAESHLELMETIAPNHRITIESRKLFERGNLRGILNLLRKPRKELPRDDETDFSLGAV